MTVHHPANTTEVQHIMQMNAGRLIVIDFTATWCGPCKAIKPKFHELAVQRPDVIFLEIDVDDPDHEQTCSAFKVTAMPTFKYIRNGQVVGETIGANLNDILQKVNSL